MSDLDLAARHRYVTEPGGKPGINVTAITGLTDDGKSMGMAYAAAKLAAAGETFRQVWKDKADVGTRVHAACEQWLRGEDAEVSDGDAGYIDALERFWEAHKPDPIEVEAVALSATHGYGGRLDFIATLAGGLTWLVDVKTGKPHPAEHSWQLAAYRYADGLGNYDDAGNLTGLRPVPSVDECGCLYLRPDGTFDLVPHPADEHRFRTFLHLLEVHRALREPEFAAHIKAVKAMGKEAA